MLSIKRIEYYINTSFENLKKGEYEELVDNYFRIPKSQNGKRLKFWARNKAIIVFWDLIRKHAMKNGNVNQEFDFSDFHFPEFNLCILTYINKEKILQRPALFWNKGEKAIFTEFINFTGAIFSRFANFKGVEFSKRVYFIGVTFSSHVSFLDVVFLEEAIFSMTTFSKAVSFSGATFSKATDFSKLSIPEADFSNVIFLEDVNFFTSKFSGANFSNSKFSKKVNFLSARFFYKADFTEVVFSENVNFQNVKFSTKVSFSDGIFSGTADFSRAMFSAETDFTSITFSNSVIFWNTSFLDKVKFSKTKFYETVIFPGSTFLGEVEFSQVTFSQGVDFFGSTFSTTVIFSKIKFPEEKRIIFESLVTRDNSSPKLNFLNIDFPHAFVFRKQKMEGISFAECEISKVRFESCEWNVINNYRIKLKDEDRLQKNTKNQNEYKSLEELYRQLKKNFESSRNYELMGHAYVSEMEMKKRRLWIKVKPMEWFIYWFYGFFSGYTNSIMRPLISFFTLILFGLFSYYFIDFNWANAIQRSFYASFSYFEIGMKNPFEGYWLIARNVQFLLSSIFLVFFVIALRKKFKT
ncbi:MAG: hypothetical protein GQ574_24820 [Crocinitomix sp.]|nr:hypothetical protein [Crocinitomix sp.]